MDIYVSKDGKYPRALRSGACEVFVLVGAHDAFVQACLHELRARTDRVFVETLTIAPDERSNALRVTSHASSARLRNGACVSFAQFVRLPHAFATEPVPDALPRAANGALVVHALHAPTRAPASIVFVHCVPLAPLPSSASIDGVPVTDASFLYTNPALSYRLDGCDPNTRAQVFSNVSLRAAVGELISDPARAPLAQLLARAVPLWERAACTAVIPCGNHDACRLARLSYNRNKFCAFVLAWYRGQLSQQNAENEKIARAYERVSRLL